MGTVHCTSATSGIQALNGALEGQAVKPSTRSHSKQWRSANARHGHPVSFCAWLLVKLNGYTVRIQHQKTKIQMLHHQLGNKMLSLF